MSDQGFAYPDVLVSTGWVAENLGRTDEVRLVESNEDVLLYSTGHIPNAVHIDWVADLNDAIKRDYLDEEQFANLLSRNGIGNDTMVVFYGASFIIPAVSIWFVRAFSQIPELKTSLADFLFYPTSICWIIYGQLFNFYNLSLRASPAYVVPLPGKLLWASSTFICSLLFVKALVANRRHS